MQFDSFIFMYNLKLLPAEMAGTDLSSNAKEHLQVTWQQNALKTQENAVLETVGVFSQLCFYSFGLNQAC